MTRSLLILVAFAAGVVLTLALRPAFETRSREVATASAAATKESANERAVVVELEHDIPEIGAALPTNDTPAVKRRAVERALAELERDPQGIPTTEVDADTIARLGERVREKLRARLGDNP